jgi:hypothetical protein
MRIFLLLYKLIQFLCFKALFCKMTYKKKGESHPLLSIQRYPAHHHRLHYNLFVKTKFAYCKKNPIWYRDQICLFASG